MSANGNAFDCITERETAHGYWWCYGHGVPTTDDAGQFLRQHNRSLVVTSSLPVRTDERIETATSRRPPLSAIVVSSVPAPRL